MNDTSLAPQRAIPAPVPSQMPPRPQRGGSGAPPIEPTLPKIEVGFGSIASFEFMQRAARALSSSTQIPIPFRAMIPNPRKKSELIENPNALANCMVALTMAQRMGIDVITVMWNLDVVEGRPAWRGQFVIALINTSQLFKHPLRFDFTIDDAEREYTYDETYWENGDPHSRKVTIKAKPFRCVAWTTSLDGERVESEPITLEMAIAERWYQKPGSKWQSMVGQMARYRAGAFFGRVHCPHVLYGLPTDDEARDVIDAEPAEPVPASAAGEIVRADIDGTAEDVREAGQGSSDASTGASAPTPLQITQEAAAPTVGDLFAAGAGPGAETVTAAASSPQDPPKREPVRRRFGALE